jgi:hypothetical protein
MRTNVHIAVLRYCDGEQLFALRTHPTTGRAPQSPAAAPRHRSFVIVADRRSPSRSLSPPRLSGTSSTHSYLAAYLCQEKNKKNSFWAPYLNILPQKYGNMPIFFEQDELKWLRGSFSLKKIADRKEDLLAEYDNICKYIPDFKQYSYRDFVWYAASSMSRLLRPRSSVSD